MIRASFGNRDARVKLNRIKINWIKYLRFMMKVLKSFEIIKENVRSEKYKYKYRREYLFGVKMK